MATKNCTKCKKEKALSAFGKNKAALDGLNYMCKKCVKVSNKKYYSDPESRKRMREQQKEYNQTEEAKKKRNARARTDLIKLKNKLALRLRTFVLIGRDTPINQATMGCTYAEIRAHIEKQFKDGMTWENYHDKVWQFDHTVPYHAFPTVEELQKHHKIVCWYKNVQPMFQPDNVRKSDDYNEEDKQALIRRFQLWEIEREVLAVL